MRLACAIALVFLIGCHETRKNSQERTTETVSKKKSSGQTASLEERRVNAIDAANDQMERARITAQPLTPLKPALMQGVALPLYPELPNVSWEDNLKWIAESGANYVSIVVSWDQRTIHHNRIQPDPKTVPKDERFLEVVTAAKKLGLKVMVFPILHVMLRNPGEWRGKLAPTDRTRWNEDYQAYIMHYAKLSQQSGADVFSVGSELSSLESEAAFWEGLIADVRSEFNGKLIYSANWDHYEVPKFWDKLDYVGVSAYFEVAKREDEPMFVVSQRWRIHRDRIVAFAKSQNRPAILTEVGYPSINSAATKPWDYTAKTAPNQNAQLAAFRSMAETWSAEQSDAFGGLFIWHGWGAGGPEDLSYSFWNKYTHAFVKEWFAQ